MSINPADEHPNFCKNCTHRFICAIQCNFDDFNNAVEQFNEENRSTLQSATVSYVCRYKTIDLTV